MALTHGGNIFAVARERGWDWRDILDFSASINPLGPSENVHKAICGSLERVVHYPERDGFELRAALAKAWNVDAGHIIAGNGATELIYFLARVLKGKAVTIALPAFSEFHRAFPDAGTADLADAKTWPESGVFVVTRPANPTGYMSPVANLENWIRPDRMLIVDESFVDFAGKSGSLTSLPHTLLLRSLTKFYALPGLRVGAMITSEPWATLREPWQVNALAEQAAIAAVEDTAHAERTGAFIAAERSWLTERLQELGEPAKSDANFIHVRLPCSASSLCEHLLSHRILIRNCTGWPGLAGESVRVAVRTREENHILLRTWRTFACA